MYLVRSGAISHFESLVLKLGINPIQLIRDAGLHPAQFRNPDTYIPYSKLAYLLELATQRSRIPLFGLMLAQKQTHNVLGDLPMLVSSMETLESALIKANEYLYLHAYGAQIRMQTHGDHIHLSLLITLDSENNINALMQLSVYHLAQFVANLLNISVDHIALHLRQTAPNIDKTSLAKYKHSVIFQDSFNGIRLKATLLNYQSHQDDTALNQLLNRHLQKLQNRYPENLTAQVQNHIRHLLPTGECCIEQVASALGMHPRSLQKQLKKKAQSYRNLLLDTRQDIAKHQLLYGKQTITELALQLGYAEVSVFSRHFKLWTGLSPKRWQQEHSLR